MLGYQLRLARQSIRRTPGLSLTIFITLTLSGAMAANGIAHYLRYYAPRPALSPALHQVELPHSRTLLDAMGGRNAMTNTWVPRTRVTYPEFEILAGSGLPSRQAGTYRARMLVARDAGATDPRVVSARLANADFFSLFPLPLGSGRVFTRVEEARGDAVVILSRPLAETLFAGQSAQGRDVVIDGHRFLVIGVTAHDQPYRADWDLGTMGTPQDALYLPMTWGLRLLARPEHPVYQGPIGTSFDELLRSSTVFVAFWAELPTAESRTAYRRYLATHLKSTYTLRSWPEWSAALPVPGSAVSFFSMMGLFVLLAGALNATRLLLAKGLSRREELGVHRALGATRYALFLRQILEVALVALPAAIAATLLAIPYAGIFNRLVADNDIPVRFGPVNLLAGAAVTFLAGLLAGLYPAWHLARTRASVQFGKRLA